MVQSSVFFKFSVVLEIEIQCYCLANPIIRDP